MQSQPLAEEDRCGCGGAGGLANLGDTNDSTLPEHGLDDLTAFTLVHGGLLPIDHKCSRFNHPVNRFNHIASQ